MSRKDALNSLFLGKPTQAPAGVSPAKHPDRVRSGAIGAMGTSLQELTQGAMRPGEGRPADAFPEGDAAQVQGGLAEQEA